MSKGWVPKLIALDLDGTTLDSSGRISARTKRAVARVRERDIEVIIVTFRAYRSSKPYVLELGLHLPLICVNGALVKDASDDRVLESFPLAVEAARQAVAYGVRNGHEMCLFIDECYVGDANVIAKYGAGFEHQWRRSDDLRAEVAKHETLMVRFFGDHRFEEARRSLAHLGTEYVDDWLNDIFELTLMRSGVSKHFALERFAAGRGIARTDIMAIGDGALDAGMLAWAGRGVAVGNAAREALAAADEIAGSNDHEGVAAVLERFAEGV